MATAQKCVHKGCGKVFTDPNAEDCVYHPGPPEFHEGQKGWMCCKPRVLTFDEFLEIPPCTTGKHSAVDDTPVQPKKAMPADFEDVPAFKPISTSTATRSTNGADTSGTTTITQPIAVGSRSLATATAHAQATPRSTTPQPQLEEDSDEEGITIPLNASCKRRACGKSYNPSISRQDEECVYHPGAPLFHEGSKGWTCCKRRVLEFDEFMKIGGCKERKGHCYVGKKQQKKSLNGGAGSQGQGEEEMLEEVRNDFYQTSASVIVSFYLKKIDKDRAKVDFTADGTAVNLDLPTSDGKRFTKKVDLWGQIDPGKSQFKIMGTKLEMILAKSDGSSWPVLRASDPDTGERIQIGRAGRA